MSIGWNANAAWLLVAESPGVGVGTAGVPNNGPNEVSVAIGGALGVAAGSPGPMPAKAATPPMATIARIAAPAATPRRRDRMDAITGRL
jgi:hypothetical protein